jgi:hypothetical protein
MLDQRVQDRTTHLNDKYKRLIVGYEELHRLVMEMRSQMDDSCAPPNWLYGSGDDLPLPPPPPAPPLFLIYCIRTYKYLNL